MAEAKYSKSEIIARHTNLGLFFTNDKKTKQNKEQKQTKKRKKKLGS